MIHHRAETGSTNDDARALASAGAAEGSWVRADVQTGGRGRLGRIWVSPPGNLHASTFVRRRAGDPPPATLAFVTAVALEELLTAYAGAGQVRIKWPNDLMLDAGNGWAKAAGILLEADASAVVVGIGVNLAHRPPALDRPTAALADIAAAPAPATFVEELAASFARWLTRWRGEGFDPVRARWLERAHPVGTALRVQAADGMREGLFDGLAVDGALRLRTAEGVIMVQAGDVFLL
ncbi:biotin--[acetyl-CoA-carboxylase] ligase [Sphingomonas jatrophae]|uniref:BirA family transcriptional regulator, biotin operon repressor / biotin-[acetyl-CoA-carboxylase] ligase n=1 Tax=Sphingomonas jatrophae TaxID=1166337 RepID=A0A1I6JWF1_9SPHN|nr:biotin--[acetyl-CoA-carboxylase] ligase [Sphingomonas jatrophae]SFR82880.1 BirA family transcriptional regulator, biotin operon repressor / biotin-[acetyl-CoA-carboxylase] ligase [Sphingomonas jatrophae]